MDVRSMPRPIPRTPLIDSARSAIGTSRLVVGGVGLRPWSRSQYRCGMSAHGRRSICRSSAWRSRLPDHGPRARARRALSDQADTARPAVITTRATGQRAQPLVTRPIPQRYPHGPPTVRGVASAIATAAVAPPAIVSMLSRVTSRLQILPSDTDCCTGRVTILSSWGMGIEPTAACASWLG